MDSKNGHTSSMFVCTSCNQRYYFRPIYSNNRNNRTIHNNSNFHSKPQVAPATIRPYANNPSLSMSDCITFGQYKGETYDNIASTASGLRYLRWLVKTDNLFEETKDKIEETLIKYDTPNKKQNEPKYMMPPMNLNLKRNKQNKGYIHLSDSEIQNGVEDDVHKKMDCDPESDDPEFYQDNVDQDTVMSDSKKK